MRTVPLEAFRPFFDDDLVTEVLCNGPGPVWVERDGRLQRTALVLDERQLEHLIERVLGPVGRRVDHASPCADARLADGSRVHIVIPPVAVDGPCVSIRRFRRSAATLADLVNPAEARLLAWAVAARANIVISGAAGAGKTTMLNALASAVPAGQRVITVEDAAELALGATHVVRLEARPPNSEGVGAITVRELVRNALRMRPDRIVVGEVRGAEVADMVQAMETGHDGSFSTCHADGPLGALRRLEALLLTAEPVPPMSARERLVSCIDLVVHVERLASGGRRVREIAEVVPPGERAELRCTRLVHLGHPVGVPARVPRTADAAAFAWSHR
jgi:pilus assembly protein CpaF